MSGLAFWKRREPRAPSSKRVLVPFTGGELDPVVLAAAIRVAHAEEATLVPAYLIVTPARAGISVDARVETGRTPTHALQRLWEAEHFDRIVAPAPARRGPGFTPKELQWILMNAPSETAILRPDPTLAEGVQLARSQEAVV